MMPFFLAAAAASAVPLPADDPDLRCMAAYLLAAGNANDDPSVMPDDKAGIQSIVMYYFGKLDGRRPGVDLKSAILGAVASPGYAATLRPELERCSAEAEARGKYLQTFGEEPETAAAKP